MNTAELNALLNSTTWNLIGKGTYNHAYLSNRALTINGYTGSWVWKIPRDATEPLSAKARAVRKWNLHNPMFPAIELSTGWIAPYLGNIGATDEQTAIKVIDIYKRTRTLLIDACVKNNFLVYQGHPVCIDMDFSFRRGSIASDDYMRTNAATIPPFLTKCNDNKPRTASIIRTLLYLEKMCSERDIREEHITRNVLIKLRSFRVQGKPIDALTLDTLLDITTFDPSNTISDDDMIVLLTNGTIKNRSTNIFLFAARRNFLPWIQTLLARNFAYLSATDNYNRTALLLATKQGHADVVDFLIAKGADVNVPIHSPRNPEYHNTKALDWAIRKGYTGICHALLQAGGKTSQKPLAMKEKTLHQLIQAGMLDEVRILIKLNRDLLNQVDINGYTPLHSAASHGHRNIVEFLLAEGADTTATVPATLENCKEMVYRKLNALDIAFIQKHESIAFLLLASGCHPHPWVDGISHLIHLAAKQGLLSLVKVLVAKDPSLVLARDPYNQTALLWAAANGHSDVVAFLIAAGANVHTPTKLPVTHRHYALEHNATPQIWALRGEHWQTASLLEDAAQRSSAIAVAARESPTLAGDETLIRLLKRTEPSPNLITFSIFPPQNARFVPPSSRLTRGILTEVMEHDDAFDYHWL